MTPQDQPLAPPAVASFPETPTRRVQAHRRRAGSAGMVRVEVTVPAGMAPAIRFAARLLRDGSVAAKVRLLRFLLILREAPERRSRRRLR